MLRKKSVSIHSPLHSLATLHFSPLSQPHKVKFAYDTSELASDMPVVRLLPSEEVRVPSQFLTGAVDRAVLEVSSWVDVFIDTMNIVIIRNQPLDISITCLGGAGGDWGAGAAGEKAHGARKRG